MTLGSIRSSFPGSAWERTAARLRLAEAPATCHATGDNRPSASHEIFSLVAESAIDKLSSRISIRGLQVMGAICLGRFCAAQGIRHPAIDALVNQLWKFATADNIMNWQRERQALEVGGRGDSLPCFFAEILQEPLRSDFECLVNRVGGISDMNMFVDPPDRALARRCLSEAMEIIQRYGVPLPEQAPFEKSPPGRRGWGCPVRPELLRVWRSFAGPDSSKVAGPQRGRC